MQARNSNDGVTPCPKCGTVMTDVAITRHPVVPHMKRHTFACYSCNQTRTYVLPMPVAELHQQALS